MVIIYFTGIKKDYTFFYGVEQETWNLFLVVASSFWVINKNNVLDRLKIKYQGNRTSDVAIMSGEMTPDTRLSFKWTKYKLQFYHLWLNLR